MKIVQRIYHTKTPFATIRHGMPGHNVIACVLTVDVIDFEQKFDFVFGRLAGELMNGIDELLQRNRTGIVLVEYLEHAIRKKWLQIE